MLICESILINAPLKRVWDTFTDLTCWQDWSNVFSNISSESARLTEGTSFKFCIRPFSFPIHIEPVVVELEAERKIVWRGTNYGITARHEFLFEEKNGKTLLTSREVFKLNRLKRLFFRIPGKRLHSLSLLMLQDLKYSAENSAVPKYIPKSEVWEKK